MSLLDRFRLWRVRRQMQRCAKGRHHWKSLTPDRLRCVDPGCFKWYGSAARPLSTTSENGTEEESNDR